MTPAPKDKSKINYYHLPTWFTLANLIFLVSLSISVGSIKTKIEDGVRQNAKDIKEHKTDYNVHMPLKQKFEVFIPRTELDAKFDAIKAQLNRIEKKLDK